MGRDWGSGNIGPTLCPAPLKNNSGGASPSAAQRRRLHQCSLSETRDRTLADSTWEEGGKEELPSSLSFLDLLPTQDEEEDLHYSRSWHQVDLGFRAQRRRRCTRASALAWHGRCASGTGRRGRERGTCIQLPREAPRPPRCRRAAFLPKTSPRPARQARIRVQPRRSTSCSAGSAWA